MLPGPHRCHLLMFLIPSVFGLTALQSRDRRNLSSKRYRKLKGARPTLSSHKKAALFEVPAFKKEGRTPTKLTSQNVLIIVIYSRQRHKAPNLHSVGDPGAWPSGNGSSKLECQGVSI